MESAQASGNALGDISFDWTRSKTSWRSPSGTIADRVAIAKIDASHALTKVSGRMDDEINEEALKNVEKLTKKQQRGKTETHRSSTSGRT